MSRIHIGRMYDERPVLRQMPRHWVLEEVRASYRPRWYRRIEVWTIIIVALWLLAGAAQLGAIT